MHTMLDLDIKAFLSNIKATKPPYVCPFEKCHKIYKTYQGMRTHMHQYDHINNRQMTDETNNELINKKKGNCDDPSFGDRSPSPPDYRSNNNNRETLTYAEAQRLVEVDIDGKVHRININEPLNIVLLSVGIDVPINGSVNSVNNSFSDSKSKKHLSDCQLTPQTNANSGAKTKTGKGKNRSGKCGKGRKDLQSKQTAVTEKPNSLILKLPEPSFRIIEGYDPPDAKQRSSSYYRYIEKTIDDIDEEVEYDMDEEDTAWLELINKKRKVDKLPEIPADTFELLMDRLEKESYFLSQNSGKDIGPAIDEDAVCCICNDGECQNSNAILFCDMCNLAVHQECYGVPYIPEGQWLCRRCLQSPSRAVDCALCPNKGGAFKQTDDNRWSHVVCALWIPEVCFANTVFLEPIDSIGNIPSARWKLSCYICKQRNVGACIQCHKSNCYVAFHVTCAQQAGLYMKMEAVKEMTSNGLVTNVRKAAYCDTHTPTDENGIVLSGVYSSGEEDSRIDNHKVKQTKAKFKEKMKKARKILAEKRSQIPVVSVPTIPLDRLAKIAVLVTIPKRNLFLQRLLGYWTLKRQSRNGVPLLRRLQISHNNLRRDSNKDGDDEQVMKIKEQLKTMNRLRQDLERVRLLVELIRKREKMKREFLKIRQNTVELQLNPFKAFLLNLLQRLQDKDTNKFFAEPVNVEDVSDYLDFIKHPMDFSTIRQKINQNQYSSLIELIRDFQLIINNCTEYNTKETIWHKAALKLADQSQSILREAKKMAEIYNTTTGLHLHLTENEIQISATNVSPIQSEKKQLEVKLKVLEEDLLKAKTQKSGGSRTKRVRSLTADIAKLKDKIESINSSHTLNKSPFKTNRTITSSNVNNGSTNSRTSSPNKKKQKTTTKVKNVEPIDSSDSDTNDITNNNSNINNFIDKFEGRKTLNSVSASINSSEIEGLIKCNNNKQKSLTTHKESPSKRLFKNNIKHKSPNKSVNNNNNNKESSPKNKTRVNTKKKLNGSALTNSLSPNSITSNLSINLISDKINSRKSKNSKLTNPKSSPIIDSPALTPNNMFTETAESFAREQVSKGQTTGSKRRSNRSSSRPNKRQNTSNSMHLIDSQITTPLMSEADSFKVYRNLSSPPDSDIISESSQSHTSSSSSKTSGSSESSDSNSSLSSLGSSGTSSRVSCRKAKSPKRPRSRSSDISTIENQKIPLQPNDLVWAKFGNQPWYPAVIVDSNSSVSNSPVNGTPVPPEEVLALAKDKHNQYLVYFFEHKNSWHWLARHKLEPLGIETSTDNQKLNQNQKSIDKKALQKAYNKALAFYASLQ
ncbi:bromodomain-containing protein 1-like [Oppia nitens]|uniref:bromodomain-containing protein 1-like n=1 Tax=Oppia nitens TaxID=1686743 RepID=UPI0023D9ED0B|nr:bromodomain-containing protein 1-like [Oppia nitens]